MLNLNYIITFKFEFLFYFLKSISFLLLCILETTNIVYHCLRKKHSSLVLY